jgi:hypothetical protein
MLPERKLVSYRMNVKVLALIDALSAKLGMGKTAVLSLAVRALAKRERNNDVSPKEIK